MQGNTEQAEDTTPVTPKRMTHRDLLTKGEKDKAMYKVWCSIPAMLRLLPSEEQKKMGYDADDPLFQAMVKCRTKKEFCEVFGVSINQPARWEKEPGFLDEVNHLSTTNHVLRFKKDVDFAFTQKVLKHGDAPRYKLWKQIHEGWRETIQSVGIVGHTDAASLVKAIEERNKAIRELSPTAPAGSIENQQDKA